MTDEYALELRNVSKAFGDKAALAGVDLRVRRGTTHVLLGASGSGKTTLIRIVIGLTEADGGSLYLNGTARGDEDGRHWLHRIGYVPQEGGLFPHLTGRQNITLVARTLGRPQTAVRDRVEELRSLMSIDDSLLDRFPKHLSGGQRQRVALMRAAFLDPTLLILDEPLGALDPITRADVQDELKRIFNSLGKTVLMVTHDLDEARFFGHELSLLHEGRRLQTGPYEELSRNPADPYVTRFLTAQRPREGQ
jgi:osmoprotectant transport system ATP-binding protein